MSSKRRHKHVRGLGCRDTGKQRRGTGNYGISGWEYHPTKGFRKVPAHVNPGVKSLLALLT